MTKTGKCFAILTIISFALGIFFQGYFTYLEDQARRKLPPEMRTPEAIQLYYDDSVCLDCDVAGMAGMALFFAIGIIFLILTMVYETFLTKQQSFK